MSTIKTFFDRFLTRNKKGNHIDNAESYENSGTESERRMRDNRYGTSLAPSGSLQAEAEGPRLRETDEPVPTTTIPVTGPAQEATYETIVIYTHKVFDHEPALERSLIEKKAKKAYPIMVINTEKDLLLVRHPIALLVWHDVELKHPEIITHLADRGLKCVVRVGSGYEHIDHENCAMRGIVVSSLPAFGVDEMADSTMCMILNLLRGTHRIASRVRDENRFLTTTEFGICRRVRGTHLGLIGLGAVGTSVALRAKAFGMKVSFFDPYIPEGFEKSLHLHRSHSVIDLLQRSDVVSLHAGINGETRHLISKVTMRYMKKGSYLINNGRGGLIEEEAVIEALRSGHLAGVALDVIDNEIHYDGRWKDVPNLILTAHSSYYSRKSFEEMRKNAILEAIRVIHGGINRARYPINKMLFDRFRRFKTKRHKERFVPPEESAAHHRVHAHADTPPPESPAFHMSPRDIPNPEVDRVDVLPAFNGQGDIFHPSTTSSAVPSILSKPNLLEQDRVSSPSGHGHWLPRPHLDTAHRPLYSPRKPEDRIVIHPDYYAHPGLIERVEEVPEWNQIPYNPNVCVIQEVTGHVLREAAAESASPPSSPGTGSYSGSSYTSRCSTPLSAHTQNMHSQSVNESYNDDFENNRTLSGDSAPGVATDGDAVTDLVNEHPPAGLKRDSVVSSDGISSTTEFTPPSPSNSLTLGRKSSVLTPLSRRSSGVITNERDSDENPYLSS